MIDKFHKFIPPLDLRSHHEFKDGNPLNWLFHKIDHGAWNVVTLFKYGVILAIVILIFNWIYEKFAEARQKSKNLSAEEAKRKQKWEADWIERIKRKHMN